MFLEEETKKIRYSDLNTPNSNFPDPASGTSARSIKHLIVMPDAFKSLCMMINTEKGKQIKQYYLSLEKLIQSYFIYQSTFKGLLYKTELQQLKNLQHIQKYTQSENRIRLNKEIKNYNKIGTVYYIQEEISKNIKIGYTYNLSNRLVALQIGNSQKLNIVHTINCRNPYDVEQNLHKENKTYHIHGEWYMSNVL